MSIPFDMMDCCLEEGRPSPWKEEKYEVGNVVFVEGLRGSELNIWLERRKDNRTDL